MFRKDGSNLERTHAVGQRARHCNKGGALAVWACLSWYQLGKGGCGGWEQGNQSAGVQAEAFNDPCALGAPQAYIFLKPQ